MVKKKLGYFHLITGPMFAGKTELLLKELESLEISFSKVLIFKPKASLRFSHFFIVSHSGKNIRSHLIDDFSSDQIFSHLKADGKYHTIVFDEIHFFDLAFFKVVQKLLTNGYNVLASGLDKGFSEHHLPIMEKLIVIANRITKLKGNCFLCGKLSTKTQAVDVSLKPIPPSAVTVLAGGKEKYQTRCDSCYIKFEW